MQIVYAKEQFPDITTKSIFLAGPTPREKTVEGWRRETLDVLASKGYDGIVFVPETRDGMWKPEEYTEQVEWEEAALKRADCILFWIPRKMGTMPALTTNTEFGVWHDSGKVVLGFPSDADAVRYQAYYANKLKVPTASMLDATVDLALEMIGKGALREAGECQVPLHVWKHKTFQAWLKAQKDAGNRLDAANVLWTFRVGPKRDFVFSWILHVDVYVGSENRHKTNEFVFGRTDVSGVVLYRRCTAPSDCRPGLSVLDTEVVIIREFRSPARTRDGFIWEITAGSSKDTDEATLSVAAHEVEEEAGIKLDPSRLRKIGVRQVAGTLSAHQATVYAAELTEAELNGIKMTRGTVRGVEEDTERTYADVLTLRQVLEDGLVDWATLGMLVSALMDE